MIYLFHGSDVEKVRAKAFEWTAKAKEKAPDALYIRLSADQVSEQTLEEVRGAQGLFFTKALVLLDDPFADSRAGEAVLASLKELAASENPIAILAPKLISARVKKIEAVAAKVFVFDKAEKKTARGFNAALVNALAARDRELLWKEIVKAHRAGDVPEMVHGLLHWKARDLMQKGGRGWTKEEARALSLSLIALLSDSRGGELELSLMLERWAFSI